ncbi:interferon-inducible GTPase 5-like [Protobothrops mucrosquamatus]|uniref:interferon-inducible GTPase 5-like n=1 Tax=Protobothrops mucrosquamatus TaxID=103944 RepID=UPI0007758CC2|nr:interferon-inducible GTPase 5-like [Protobothrops mucrosquamatus]
MAQKVDDKIALTEKQIEDLKAAFKTGSFDQLTKRLQDAFSSLEDINLNVAVVGESGEDRAAFINTFRDLCAEDEGAASPGMMEANKTPVAYPHPKYPKVILWDLPDIGNPGFSARRYVEKMELASYDFFLIIASQHFRSFHAKLAYYVKKAGKGYYFVRSKVEADLESIRQSNPSSFNELITLQKIREDCLQDLQAEKVRSPKIFLISSLLLSKYDFYLLEETLEKNLDLPKSHSFLLATPNISHRILEKKKDMMLEHLWLVAVVACGIQTEAISDISVACNVDLLVRTMQGYCISFGLEEDSLRRTAEHVDQPVEQLKALIKSPLAPAVTKAVVVELLVQAASRAPNLPKQLVPMASVGLSFAVVYSMLKTFVEDVATDAHRLLVKVFMSHKGTNEPETSVSKVLENQGHS